MIVDLNGRLLKKDTNMTSNFAQYLTPDPLDPTTVLGVTCGASTCAIWKASMA